jgi:hypothetical protein
MEKNKNIYRTVGPRAVGLGSRYFVQASCPAPLDGTNVTYLAHLILLHLIDLMTISKKRKSQNCSLCQKNATNGYNLSQSMDAVAYTENVSFFNITKKCMK